MNSVIKEERHIRIMDYLKENQTAKLADLAELNRVSIDTVRRDLRQLDEKGMLKQVRGGAVFLKDDLAELQTINKKETPTSENERRELAQLVGSLISDGQAVALNSGTTNIDIAKYLVDHYLRLTILTNSLQIIGIMKKAKNFTVIIPGGIIDINEGAIYGDSCVRDISKYNIDIALLDVHSISMEKGITEDSQNQGDVIAAMIRSSKKRAIVADHGKFNKVSYLNVCDLSCIDYIITDSRLPKELHGLIEQKQIQIIAPKQPKQ